MIKAIATGYRLLFCLKYISIPVELFGVGWQQKMGITSQVNCEEVIPNEYIKLYSTNSITHSN